MNPTASREIAILQASLMQGSDFILPVKIKRVIRDAFPTTEAVYDLLRDGGFRVEVKTVDLNADLSLHEALEEEFRDLLPSRPVFVDLYTGHIYVTRSMGEGHEFLAHQGDVFGALDIRLPEARDGMFHAVITSRVRMLPINVIRTARPELSPAEVKHAIDNGTPISMSTRDLARTIVAAVCVAAQRHRDITNDKITGDHGAYTTTTVIASCTFA
jgi:hypothetical protein